jgi:demethoxyubiquinone hydroxylase (CLK1/Coq7/Cat5 family)
MRLGWYRHVRAGGDKTRRLRERKATQQAFLQDLLRRRGLSPAWYAIVFYFLGHALGITTRLLPEKTVLRILYTLEWWILIRYERYAKKLSLLADLRSMIEAVQLARLSHNEPGEDVLSLLNRHIVEEKNLLNPQN